MHVTLQDVAQRAQVSTKTVSRVVNQQGEISAATRKRVQDAIEQLGYRPNILARSLVSQRSKSLAVITSGLEYYGPSNSLIGIENQSFELGYSLLFSLLPKPDITQITAVLDSVVARQVDGIIWAVPEINNNRSWIRPEILKNLPPIVFLSMAPMPGLSIVAVDNRSGASQAVSHLASLGRKTIGLISGPMDWWEARERIAGYQEVIRAKGLEESPSLMIEGDWTASSGKRTMLQLLDQRPDIDAVFACNDQMALGALGAAHLSGRKIPQDIAVVGFDNIPESACFWPPISTVEHPLLEAGCISVQLLQSLIEKEGTQAEPAQASSKILPAQLIIRASSAGFSESEQSQYPFIPKASPLVPEKEV